MANMFNTTNREIMARAWAIFRADYGFGPVSKGGTGKTFAELGRAAFARCLARAWREARFDFEMRSVLASLPAPKFAPVNFGAFGIRTSRMINRKAFGRTYLAA